MQAGSQALASVAQLPNWQVREATDVDAQRWEAFVEKCGEATFFHRFGWRRVIEKAFGHRTHYLFAERDGEVDGILPLGQIKSRLFGNSLVSTPFCVYGGVAGSERAGRLLVDYACKLGEALGVQYLELRHRREVNPAWPRREIYVTFRKELASDPEENLRSIPRKQRAMVRKGIDGGLTSEIDEDTNRFYRAYSESVRNLGTPVFSRKYFSLLKETFGSDCEILSVIKGKELISSVLSFYFRDEVLPYYGGGREAARACKGNDFMYWELMRRACMRGVRIFDYGRSKKGTGSFRFKTHWGFEPEPLHYEVRLFRGDKLPEVNPTNPKYRALIALWKRLPLPIANVLGPVIANDLG